MEHKCSNFDALTQLDVISAVVSLVDESSVRGDTVRAVIVWARPALEQHRFLRSHLGEIVPCMLAIVRHLESLAIRLIFVQQFRMDEVLLA